MKEVKVFDLKPKQKVIINIKNRVGKNVDPNVILPTVSLNTNKEEALAALVMLGFNSASSSKIIDKIISESPDLQLEKIIKEALRRM